MRKIHMFLIVLIVFTLSGCNKKPEDFIFDVDPNLGNEFSNFGDFLLEVENNIEHELLIEYTNINGNANYTDGNYEVWFISLYSDSVIEEEFYNQDSIYCSDLMWGVEDDDFHCKYSYNYGNDFTFEDIFVTIEEIAGFIELADSATLESLNEIDWQLSLFDEDHVAGFAFYSYENHLTNFDNGMYHYGLYTEDGFITSGEHTLDGIYFELNFYSNDPDEVLMLYFLLE